MEIQDITCFLQTFNESCKDDAEFGEWSNDLLFKVLQSHPSGFISILSKDPNVDKKIIYGELSDPIRDDNYNIDKIIKIVNAARGDRKTKNEIISYLKIALQRID